MEAIFLLLGVHGNFKIFFLMRQPLLPFVFDIINIFVVELPEVCFILGCAYQIAFVILLDIDLTALDLKDLLLELVELNEAIQLVDCV